MSVTEFEATVFDGLKFCIHNPFASDGIENSFNYQPLATDMLRGG